MSPKKPESDAVRRARAALVLAETRAVQAQRNLDRALSALEAAREIPKEPGVNSVVKFTVQFEPKGVVYSYLAHRPPSGFWYVTGNSSAMRWEDIVKLMQKDVTTRQNHGAIRFFQFNASGAGVGKWKGRQS